MPKHWYFITWHVCEVCGRGVISRERRYIPKPTKREDRYAIEYDYYCCVSDVEHPYIND